MRALGFGCALIACARPAPPAVPPTPEPAAVAIDRPATPLAAWFGEWNEETSKFERRTRFDKVQGQAFGWRIKTACTGPVRFREVMRLPAPGDWTFAPDELPGTTISDDRTTTTTIDYAACKAGWVEHDWFVADGDPVGTYVITVELDGYTAQTFRPRFVAVEP